ncbi:hypothetical protein [Exiguobacterium profundum]
MDDETDGEALSVFASTFVLNEVMQVGFFESFEPRFLWLWVVFHSRSQFMELPTVV